MVREWATITVSNLLAANPWPASTWQVWRTSEPSYQEEGFAGWMLVHLARTGISSFALQMIEPII